MSEPYVGQIMFGAFAYAPQGYALCDGSVMTIQQNQALYSLIYTTYGTGGAGQFKLPDLRGRVAVGAGVSQVTGLGYSTGTYGGAESVTLTAAQLPAHIHMVNASTAAGNISASNNIPAKTAVNPKVSGSVATTMYGPAAAQANIVPLDARTVSDVGAGQAHPNMQPFLVATAVIATTGIYPQRP